MIAAVEAILRSDSILRYELKLKDSFSIRIRHQNPSIKNINKIKFSTILSAWRSEDRKYKDITDKLERAFKYRHWVAHGRYWDYFSSNTQNTKYDIGDIEFITMTFLTTIGNKIRKVNDSNIY